MKLYSLFNENHVLIDQPATTLAAAIDTLLGSFGGLLPTEATQRLRADLLEREEQHPTCIVEGVCLPHMRLEALDRFLVGLLVPRTPIAHPREDQPEVAIVFMILAPQNKNTMMLQTLAAIARLLKSREIHQAMLGVRSANRLIRLIEETGIDVKKNLVAADIMSPVERTVHLDTILARAVDILVDAPDEGIPVLDDRDRLAGELTTREVLQVGMPKYVDLIVNASMLDNFEPFENYFHHENTMTVREICRRDVAAVEPATPVVQVTHIMMTRRVRRVYVVEEEEVKGVIFRKSILGKVLHY